MIHFIANSGTIAGIIISLVVLLLIITSVVYFVNKRNPGIMRNLKSRYSTFINEEKNEKKITGIKNPIFTEMETVNLLVHISY